MYRGFTSASTLVPVAKWNMYPPEWQKNPLCSILCMQKNMSCLSTCFWVCARWWYKWHYPNSGPIPSCQIGARKSSLFIPFMLGKLGLGVSLAASTETTIKVDKIFRPWRNIKILFFILSLENLDEQFSSGSGNWPFWFWGFWFEKRSD